MTTARGIPTAAHSSQSSRVTPSIPSVAATTKSAQSAARRPALRSPVKSASPGVSIRLTVIPSLTKGVRARFTDRFCLISTSSKSLAVVPSSTRPARATVPVCKRSASAKVVFPLPEWPTSTTLRMPPAPDSLPAPACPAPPELPVTVTLVASSRSMSFCPHSVNPTGALPQDPREESMRWRQDDARLVPDQAISHPSKIDSVMLNFLRPFFARLFSPLIQALARTPVTPNMITVTGTLGVAAAALAMFPIGWLFPGAATATVFIFTDMLDGQLARIKGSSGKYGAFLDSTMDRFGDAAIFGGITIWFMRSDHLLAVVSLFCLAGGMSVSYVKARAEGLGLNADVGLIERPERVLIGLTSIGLSGLGVPYVLPIGMWALAAGTAITLFQRMRAVYVDAKSKAAQAGPAGDPSAATTAAVHPEEG